METFNDGVNVVIDSKKDVEKVFSRLTEYFYKSTTQFKNIPILLMISTALVVIAVFGTQLVIYFRTKNQCHSCGFLTKFCLIFFAFINFVFSGIMIVFVLLNFSIGGLCDYAHLGLYGGDGFESVTEFVPTNLNSFMSEECIKDQAVGKKMVEYINFDSGAISNFDQIFEFINGISYYNNFLKTLNPDIEKNSITSTESIWDLYKTGILYNFENISRKILS